MNETTERLLADWLAEGPDRGPVPGLERALAATRRTSQRPGWTILERWNPMQLTMRPALAPPRLLLLVAVGLLAIALAATIAFVASQRHVPAPPFGPAANGSILVGVGSDLYLLDADAKAVKPLDMGRGVTEGPVFSPDGTKVAFYSRPANGEPTALFVANADGSGARSVSGPVAVSSVLEGMAWSPDGSSIIFPSKDGGTNRLYRVELAGGNPQVISGREADRRLPIWSPDGRWIAYKLTSTSGDPFTALAIARPDGTGERMLVYEPDALAAFSAARWTNDSNRLIYFRSSASGHSVAMVDLRGKETILSGKYEDAVNPEISPDGRRVYFGLALGSAIVDIDHPTSRVDIPHGLAECGALWAPNGTALLGFGWSCAEMYRIPLDDPSAAVKVALPSGGISNASWQRLAP